MALSQQQSQSMYGTPAYTGWGEAEAAADFRSKGGQAGGSSGGSDFSNFLGGISSEINKYADELITQANGDYDYVAKWVEAQYKQALGSDDTETANFLKQVANGLEAKVGRIEFDYQTKTYRTNEAKSLALKRLSEDEATSKQQLTQDAKTAREQQAGDLNARGIVSGPRDAATGLAGKNVNQLETNINDKFAALARATDRSSQDITTGATQTQQDTTTAARRAAEDAQMNKTQTLEAAARARDKAKKAAENERYGGLKAANSYADYFARGASGL